MAPFVIATGTMTNAKHFFIRGRLRTPAWCWRVILQNYGREKIRWLYTNASQNWIYILRGNKTIKRRFMDSALFDLASKHAGLPLYQFLKGERRDITTDITLGIASPEEMAEKAANLQREGAVILKVKLGKDPQTDINRIKAIRKAVGFDMPFGLDAIRAGHMNKQCRLAVDWTV
ncbi:hypothetical protein FQR65_LT15768 [Abscondita terminalis]|nr:hypothetical protein FQR65_LT15768 [Abscondita terminalis]